ncbi:MAG: THxN family PEP-CTERM protein, partial [Solirubrobacterales bacterium]|nr:THxN family PEP-CTERM protein [Solirubrobacterales bacterium]
MLLLGVFAVFVALLAGLTLRQDSANALDFDDATGTWTAWTPSPPTCGAGLNTAEIRWGDAGSSCGSLSNRSGYRWDGNTTNSTITPGTSFLLGKFTHYNRPIEGTFLTGATLGLPLAFLNPAQTVNLSVNFAHHETNNDGSCEYAGPNGPGDYCADRVQLPNIGDQQFTVGGTTYILEFTGFRPLTGDTCSATDPGGSSVDTFYTQENAENRACIYAKLTVVRTVRVIKLADGSNTGTFSGTITPGGPTAADDAFSVSLSGSGNSTADVNTVTTDAQVVTETTLPADWSLVGYYVKDDPNGDATCSGSESYTKDGNNATTVPQGEGNYLVCIKNTKAVPGTGNLIIGKVKDPTAEVPAADGTTFSGTITNDNTAAITPWTGITFGQFTPLIPIPAGVNHTVDETEPAANGWTEVAWKQGDLDQAGKPVCPADKASYVPGSNIAVNVNDGQTIVLCVMNSKTAASTPKLTVIKDVISGTGQDPQDFTFTVHKVQTGTDPLIGTVTLDDDPTSATPQSEQISLPAIGGDDDTYRITEGSVAGWDLDSATCTGAAWSGWVYASGWQFRVKVDANHMNPTCTFKNKDKRAKIIVKKVVTGAGADASQLFTADIVNTSGGPGGGNDKAFSQNQPYSVTFDPNIVGDNFRVTEDVVPANWALTGKKVLPGDVDCPATTSTSWTEVSGTTETDRRLSQNDIDREETFTFCFRNAYTPPDRNLTICKVVEGNGDLAVRSGQFKFDYYPQGGT